MDFAASERQRALRDAVRAFLEEGLGAGRWRPVDDPWIVGFDRGFSRALGARGWIGMTWPRRYGGAEASYLDRLIVAEELLRAGAPVAAHWFGDRQIGPALLAYGSDEQREAMLPRIVRGEVVFCIGMSEPGAGSDLAGLRTRAVEDGGGWLVSGHKIWTSYAHQADYCYLVARTDPAAPKHRGLSEFLVDMRLAGITVRPVVDATGEHHFNEVFFEGVRVPRAALVGVKNRGWTQIASQLDYERSGIERLLSNWRVLRDVCALARERRLDRDPVWRDRLTRVRVRIEIGRWMIYRVAWKLSRGVVPNLEAAATKAFATETEQEAAEAAAAVLGLHSTLVAGSPAAVLAGRVARAALYAPAYTIQGGTSEILRNIIATRGLGLPAGRPA